MQCCAPATLPYIEYSATSQLEVLPLQGLVHAERGFSPIHTLIVRDVSSGVYLLNQVEPDIGNGK